MARPKSPKTKNEAVAPSATPPVPVVNKPGEIAAPATAETKTEARKTEAGKTGTRKMAIVKPESRATIIPINLHDEIRRLAYLLSEQRGFEAGHETEDWLAAEREVLQRYPQQSA